MVEFDVKIHPQQGTAYIPKEIREALGTKLTAIPNRTAVLLYPKNTPIKDVVKSLTIIKQDLEHAAELEKETQKK